MTRPKLAELYRYPVKSMGGEQLASIYCTRTGIRGDRAWALKDETTGGIKGGKRFPELMNMRARFKREPTDALKSPPVAITLADGQQVSSSDSDINETLSKAVGSPLSLWPLLPDDQVEHYRRPAGEQRNNIEDYLREVFTREPGEPLPDLSAFPKKVFINESLPGTYFDALPILLMTNAALRKLQRISQEAGVNSLFDIRRFRPNLLIDVDGEGFPENDWVGRRAAIGEAVLKVETICPRCVMTTHGFADLPQDAKIMRQLVQQNGGNLGVYLNVEEPGAITVGDNVTWL